MALPNYCTRFIFTSAVSGSAWPFTFWSRDIQVRFPAPAEATIFVEETFPPSASTDALFTIHFAPSFVQVLSPNPPSAWKVHDRICFAAGSHPIHCVDCNWLLSLDSTVRVETMKFW